MPTEPAPTSSLRPVPKIAAAGTGGMAAVILIIVAKLIGVDLGPEAAAGIVLLATTGAGFLKKDKRPNA